MSVIKSLHLKITYDENKCYTSAVCRGGRSMAAAWPRRSTVFASLIMVPLNSLFIQHQTAVYGRYRVKNIEEKRLQTDAQNWMRI